MAIQGAPLPSDTTASKAAAAEKFKGLGLGALGAAQKAGLVSGNLALILKLTKDLAEIMKKRAKFSSQFKNIKQFSAGIKNKKNATAVSSSTTKRATDPTTVTTSTPSGVSLVENSNMGNATTASSDVAQEQTRDTLKNSYKSDRIKGFSEELDAEEAQKKQQVKDLYGMNAALES